MKTLAHVVGLAFALVLTALGSGCASKPTASYHQPAQDFEVVESSAKRPLTNSELAEVRASVASYLEREGATDGGDYFLKVYLTPDNVDAESEWVVVRFTRYTAQRVAVVGAYPYDDLMYSPYYSYDIYPYGYGCVSRISFQYYVDPFYGQHYYYYPRYGYGGHKDGHHGHDTADNHDHGGGKPGNPPGDGNDHGPKPPARPKYGAYGGGRPGVPLAENENPPQRDNLNNVNSSASGLPQAPRVTPTRWIPPAGNVDYRPVAEKPAVRRPSNVTQTSRVRPEGAPTPTPTPNRNLNPNRNEARINTPQTDRPAPSYRPAQQQQQRNYQPASQPARNYQQSPSPQPSYQSAPAHSSPPPSNSSQSGGDGQKQENLR